MKKYFLRILSMILSMVCLWAEAQEAKRPYTEFSLELELSNRFFFENGLYPGQNRNYVSLAAMPEYFIEWADGNHSIKFLGFARWDQHDNRRTHVDIREFYWQTVKGATELSIGVKKVFWGKTEAVHLVDIINQTDFVESFDGEEKLGEGMVHLSQYTNFGTFDVFVMPYFRKRVFPGREGRLRPGSANDFVLDSRDFEFEGSAEEFRPSFAGRWSHYIGKFDLAVSHFYGTGREPVVTDLTTFNAVYGIINQTGLELQATTGPMLWKFESIYRANDFQDVFALAAGFEYTFGNVKGSGLDIGILGEYLHDDRKNLALSSLQSDVFTGLRFAFNDVQDTQILTGAIFDVNRTTQLYFIEANRRIGTSWSVEIETRIFNRVDPDEFTYVIRDDSFLQFKVSKFF